MKAFPWQHLLAGLLSAFFLLGGYMNIFASAEIGADYARWGYPAWFHYLTGALEWTSAALIAVPRFRLAGSMLAAGVMAAAAATVVIHGEFGHAIPPLTVLAFLGLNGWLARRQSAPRS